MAGRKPKRLICRGREKANKDGRCYRTVYRDGLCIKCWGKLHASAQKLTEIRLASIRDCTDFLAHVVREIYARTMPNDTGNTLRMLVTTIIDGIGKQGGEHVVHHIVWPAEMPVPIGLRPEPPPEPEGDMMAAFLASADNGGRKASAD